MAGDSIQIPIDEIDKEPSPKYIQVQNITQSEESKKRWGELNGIYKMTGYLDRKHNGKQHASHYRYQKRWVDCAFVNDTRAGDKHKNYFVTKCTGRGDEVHNCNSKDSHADREENWYVLQIGLDGEPSLRSGRHWWVKVGKNKSGNFTTSTIEWLEGDGAYDSMGNCPRPMASIITNDEFPGTWVIRSSESNCCPDDDGRGIVYAYQVVANQGEARPKYGISAPCPKNGKWFVACTGSQTPDSYGNPCLTVNHNSPTVRTIEIAWKIDYAPWTVSMQTDDLLSSPTIYDDGNATYRSSGGGLFQTGTPREVDRQKSLQTKMTLPDAIGVRTGHNKNTVWFEYGIEIETNWETVNTFVTPVDRDISPTIDQFQPEVQQALQDGASWSNILTYVSNRLNINKAVAMKKILKPEFYGPSRRAWLPAEYEIIGLAGNDGKSVFFGKCVTIDGLPVAQWINNNRSGQSGVQWVRKLVQRGNTMWWEYKRTDTPLPLPDLWKGPARNAKDMGGNVPSNNSIFIFKEGEWKIIKRSGYPMIPQGLPGWSFISKNAAIYYLNTVWNHTDADPTDPDDNMPGAFFDAAPTRDFMKLRKAELYQQGGTTPLDPTTLYQDDGWHCDFMVRSKDPYNAENNFSVPSSQINPPAQTTPMWIRYWTAPEHVDVNNRLPDLPESQVPIAGQSGTQHPPVISEATQDQWNEQQGKLNADESFANC